MIKALITLLFFPFYLMLLVLKIMFLPLTLLFGGSKKNRNSYGDGFDDGLLAGWFLFDDWE